MERLRQYTYTEPSIDGKDRKVVYKEGSVIKGNMCKATISSILSSVDSENNTIVTIYVSNSNKESALWKIVKESKHTTYVKEFDWKELLK